MTRSNPRHRKPQIRLPKKIRFNPGRYENANAFEHWWQRMNERIRRAIHF